MREEILSLFFDIINPAQKDTFSIAMAYKAGLGDTYYVCSLTENLLLKHNVTTCVIYMKKHHFFIARMFSNIEARELPKWMKADHIENIDWDLSKIFYAHIPESVRHFIGFKDITLFDSYKALFDLPSDTKPSKPLVTSPETIAAAKKILVDQNIAIGKTCIIAPEANSSPSLPPTQIKLIYDHIESTTDLTPVIMTVKSARIPGCTYINIPLELINACFELAGSAVSVRSGLCDVLSATTCNLTVIYPDIIWMGGPFISGTSLVKSGLSDTAKEYLLADYLNKIT